MNEIKRNKNSFGVYLGEPSSEQLNKGEARHALCRNIFYGRKGKLYQTYYDGMEEQLNALGLVTNAIIYWNSLYLEKVFEQIKTEGFDCSEEVLRKQFPLISDHINFVGKYSFRYEKIIEWNTTSVKYRELLRMFVFWFLPCIFARMFQILFLNV